MGNLPRVPYTEPEPWVPSGAIEAAMLAIRDDCVGILNSAEASHQGKVA